ncbi:MAG: hypothetical protein KDJ16_00075 [Hyphomicrobiales bacterium]|nr:hypothetical protein [Hyphomicrobiales bacterium]
MPARHLLLTCSLLLAAVACGDDADESTAVGSCGAGPAVGDRALRVATTVAPITNLVAIVAGGTDTHLMLVDLRPKGLTGKVSEQALLRAGITCNKNGIPFDPEKPMITSGVRLGSPACTSRGFGIGEFRQVGEMIAEVLDVLSQKGVDEDTLIEKTVREKVFALTSMFPIYRD